MSLDVSLESDAIDTQALVARCMGNVSFAHVLLGELEATGGQRVDEIAGHAAAADCSLAADAAHSLKGAAGIVAAERLRSLAEGIESAGKARDLGRVSSLVDDLRREMTRCLDAASRFRARTADAKS